jgi:hypothetical protein
MTIRAVPIRRAARIHWQQRMLQAIIVAALFSCFVVAGALAIRAAWTPRPPATPASLAVLVTLILLASALLHRLMERTRFPAVGHWILALCPLLVAFSITCGPMAMASKVVIWGTTFAAESIWIYRLLYGRRGACRQSGNPQPAVDRQPSSPVSLSATAPGAGVPGSETASGLLAGTDESRDLADAVVQQTTRLRTASGDQITGILRAFLLAEQRSETLHVSFCPPLTAIPEIVVEQLAGPPATVKVAEVQTYGARFEMRMNGAPRQPVMVTLRWRTDSRESSQNAPAAAAPIQVT